MGTRAGAIDAAIVDYMMEQQGNYEQARGERPEQEVRRAGRVRRVLRLP